MDEDNKKDWGATNPGADNAAVHILPMNDLRAHDGENGTLCPCMPIRGTEGEIIHNSYDGRELGEVCAMALDKLALALTNHNHTWTLEERAAYDHALQILGMHYDLPEQENKPK